MISRLSFFCNYKECRNPYENLAIEEYLMHHAARGEVILFVWQNRRTVVIGRNQDAEGECRVKELLDDGGFLARRLTGGGAVYHDTGNINFSFLVNREDYDVPRQLSVILEAVKSFGIPAEKSGRNDLKIEGRKFSGNAFRKTKDGCCHHGTLLLSESMEDMVRYLNTDQSKMNHKGVRSVPSRVVNLQELNPAVTVDALAEALRESFSAVYGLPVHVLGAQDIRKEALQERMAFFSDRDWILGRRIAYTHQQIGRWDWGFVKLYLTEEKGIVKDVSIDSDSLEADLIAGLPDFLKGKLFRGTVLAEALREVPAETEEQRQILGDLEIWIAGIG